MLCRGPCVLLWALVGACLPNGTSSGLCLTIKPQAFDFGSVPVHSLARASVVLSNTCASGVTGISAASSGPDRSLFSVSGLPASLHAGAAASIQISYAPVELTFASQAAVTFSGAGSSAVGLDLSGKPVAPALSVSPPSIDFGFVPLFSRGVSSCVQVSNATTSPPQTVQLTAVDLVSQDGSVFGVKPTLPTQIPAGASESVCFNFNPLDAGEYTAEASLITDDPNGQRLPVSLHGWGGGPLMSCTAPDGDRVDFGWVPDGTEKSLSIVCTNVGTPLTGQALEIGPLDLDGGPFTATLENSELQPGQSATIQVTYATQLETDD